MGNDSYFGVCPNGPSDFKTGTPTLTISNGVGTFSEAQTHDLMGIGALVTYDTNKNAYIKSKTSTTVWDLVDENGNAAGDITGATVGSIAHPYTSLATVEPAISSKNLVTDEKSVWITCYCEQDTYEDDGPAGSDWTSWTVSADYTVKFYTPYDTSTECNLSMRPTRNGWDDTRYRFVGTTSRAININALYIEGLQIRTTTANCVRQVLGGQGFILSCFLYNTGSGVQTASANGCAFYNSIIINTNASNPNAIFARGGRLYSCYIKGPVSSAGSGFKLANSFLDTTVASGTPLTFENVIFRGYDNEVEGGTETTQTDSQLFTTTGATYFDYDFTPIAGSDLINTGVDLTTDPLEDPAINLSEVSKDYSHTQSYRPKAIKWDVGPAEAELVVYDFSGTPQKGVPISCTALIQSILAYANGDEYFDASSKIIRIDILFKHEDGRQKINIIYPASHFSSSVEWSNTARSGVWHVEQIRLKDTDGAIKIIERGILDPINKVTIA